MKFYVCLIGAFKDSVRLCYAATLREIEGQRSAIRLRGDVEQNAQGWAQQHQQQSTAAQHHEPSSAKDKQQLDQGGEEAAHDVRSGGEANSSANGVELEPRLDAGTSSTMQRSSDSPTHGFLVGTRGSQEETVNAMGRGHTRRKQREFYPGIVGNTPKPTARHTSPPTGPKKRKREGTYMTPHKARRGALKYAISVGPQLVEKIKTPDGRDQQ